MSKAFKGKACVYCAVDGISTTADHVLARKFFLPDQHHGIPKVPACDPCNNRKSQLEHYLATVLPFGGKHRHTLEILSSLVPRRLQRNEKLRREIAASWKSHDLISENGEGQSEGTFTVDADKIEELYEFIVRGLCWANWGLLLPKARADIQVGFLTADGTSILESLFAMNGGRRCSGTIADGLFAYEGSQAVDNELITVWKMSLYGVEFGDHADLNERTVLCYASTAPRGKTLPIGSR